MLSNSIKSKIGTRPTDYLTQTEEFALYQNITALQNVFSETVISTLEWNPKVAHHDHHHHHHYHHYHLFSIAFDHQTIRVNMLSNNMKSQVGTKANR